MFWKKKPMVAASVQAGPKVTATTGMPVAAPAPELEKLPGPQGMPELLGRHLVVRNKKDPDMVWGLKAVLRKSNRGKKAFEFRIYNEAKAVTQKVKVRDYNSFNDHPDLVMYQGWFDKASGQVELEDREGTAA